MEPRRRDTHALPQRHASRGAGAGEKGSASATGRALVIEPILRLPPAHTAAGERSAAAKLDEAVGLARAIDLEVEQSGIVMLNALRPATYLGKGKVDEIAGLAQSFEAGIVVMD
ncbi:MAG: GTPase HflX, partial [Xanthobacteraceae bacterium]